MAKYPSWQVDTGSPELFDVAKDSELRENIEYAAEMVRKTRSKSPRLVCRTRNGWGSCVWLYHMLAGTYYIEVYGDGTYSEVKQTPLARTSATPSQIREGKAELFRDPIYGPHISGIYEGNMRWVVK